ncbi:MAG: PAS domain S-box protein [Balneolaceae bacterium]|nr:PAS domain S-box protein [Balneolaceae bacterium]MCH8549932.1 PAS domain S-box protein [Balneolaceae bacterium]
MHSKDVVTETGSRFFRDEAMFLYDYHTLEIIDMNLRACQKYGREREEMIGLRLTDLGRKYHAGIDKGDGPTTIWVHQNSDGEEFYVQFTHQPMKYKGRTVQLAVAHDVSDKIDDLSRSLHLMPRLDTVRSNLPVATIEWDPSGNIRDWSAGASRLFGYPVKHVVGKNLFDLMILAQNGDSGKKLESEIESIRNRESSYITFDSYFDDGKGRKVHTIWMCTGIFDQAGELLSIYSVVEDNTDRKIAELQLKESEERFRVISEASLVGIFVVQDSILKYVNPRYSEITGYHQDELIGIKDPIDLVHVDDQNDLHKVRCDWRNRKIDSFEVDVRMVKKSGEMIYTRLYGSRIGYGEREALIGVMIDQTRQVETNEKFKRSVRSYRDLFDSIPDAIFIQDCEGEFVEVNNAAIEMFGYTRNELIGSHPEFLMAPGKVDLKKTENHIRAALNGEPQLFEWWARHSEGHSLPVEVQINKGTFFGENVLIAIARDITIQHRQKETLRQNEELFRQLFKNAPIGIALLDGDKKVLMVNKGFEDVFGYSEKELSGKKLDDLIIPEGKREEAKRLSESRDSFELSSVRIDRQGNEIDVLIYGVPVVVDEEIIAIYGIYVDISNQVEAEETIRRSLDEKVILLSEIHHRVKNNLAVITGLLELQYHNLENPGAKKALLDSQLRVNSMALIHEMLYQNETLSNIGFDQYIRELSEVIRRSHSLSDCEVAVQIDADPVQLPITRAIPSGLILNEILTNAFKHAFCPESTLDPTINISLKKINAELIELRISDNGQGLPDQFERIRSASLGLTLIKTLRKQLLADMQVNSGAGGTSYSIKFSPLEPEQNNGSF